MSRFVRTVLGDVAPEQLGICYAHEHVVIDDSYTTEKTPAFLLGDVEAIAQELTQAHAAGVGTMIDSMPGGGAGRNVLKIAQISKASGVHLVCPTGLHLAKYYSRGHWGLRLSEEELTDVFVSEIEQGIDANDLAGPHVVRTPHKAGLIKVAGGLNQLSDHEQKCFRAAGAAQVRTGSPILTHCEQGTAAMEQIEILRNAGADLHHVVLSHTDRKPDVAYHRELLSTGVRLEYDSAFRWKAGEPNHTLNLVVALHEQFPNQILLGMDAARRSYWKCFGGGPGMSYLVGEFVPMLRSAGVSQQAIDRILIHNPAETYSFIERKRSEQ